MSTSDRQLRLSCLEGKKERQGSEGLDMCRGGTVAILEEEKRKATWM